MDIKIIYEDDYMYVVYKPRGLVVNRAESVKGETIQDWAEKKLRIQNSELRIKNENFYYRAGIVHRLDKETSGLLVIAKNEDIFSKLQLQFKQRSIEKKYLALVHGKVAPRCGEIKASVGRLPWNRERFGVLAGGRDATTSYQVIAYYQNIHLSSRAKRGDLFQSKEIASPAEKRDRNDIFSLLEVSPHTGRTHQIRIHLKYIGHTVVGDNFYAGRKTYRRDFKFCPNLFLHARYLKMLHPVTGKKLEISCDLPSELEEVLGMMQKITQ